MLKVPSLRIVLLLAVIVSLAFLGSRSLFGTSEGRYAECGREMAETGNYIVPTLGYRPHWTKPPLTYWAVAGGINLLGPNEWGGRLYNAIAFVLIVLVVIGIGRELYSQTVGNLSGLIYATSIFPILGAYTITTDMLLALWENLAVLLYLKARRMAIEKKPGYYFILGMWAALGLGFFTKGLPALLILIPIVLFNIWQRSKPRLFIFSGILIFLIISLWWFVVVSIQHPDLPGYFLGTEVIGRVTSHSVHNHAFHKAFNVYLPVLFFGTGLWSFLWFYILAKIKLYRPENLKKIVTTSDSARFMIMWLGLPLIVFFLSASKLSLYILPIFTPLCIAVAVGIMKVIPENKFIVKIVYAIVVLSFISVVAVKAAAPYYPSKRNIKAVYNMCKEYDLPDTRFFLVQTKSWGIQFYLNGRVVRLSETGSEPWADATIESVLKNIMDENISKELPVTERARFPGEPATNMPERAVFIYQIWRHPDFPDVFSGMESVVCTTNKFWGVCKVDL